MTERENSDARPLPEPASEVIGTLFANREAEEACRFLLERRLNPPTMAEWVAHSQRVFGKANVQTQRRLREVRDHFIVTSYRRQGDGEWVYKLDGWSSTPVTDKGARISPKLQAEVYTVKGRFCAMCGAGPEDGKLQIDHIIPRSWGGKNELANLEPLCQLHNNGKKAFFASLNPYGDVLAAALNGPNPWERIGELLKAFAERDEQTPVELIELVAKDTHKGDPLKRLRELRFVLGWDIVSHRFKEAGITQVTYELRSWQPWPPEGAPEAVKAYERKRKSRKAAQNEGGDE
ncbi:HNH endonuclease signature motif containing protein [Streptomyces sp. NBC_00539]|uniref:HNH endonuclease signature motif containing protein n=1 Tax=Streptomyces sp. NBC_00539 TaxID=2975770 RepID=UPI002E805792|nr:HNH endonuclease signature motif containing protein [Streptomyces sp. NBC_00539]WUC65523.1 HNH endonuclease [Streptomyces sp. NBC_00539]